MSLTASRVSNILNNKNDVLRIVLDEPHLFLETSLGSHMIRGEVIVNFSKETYIQGPIELAFEGTQRFFPWQAIMKASPLGPTIETKLIIVELSLLPPNSKGTIPAGIQRFPFEFPIPTTLPSSVQIEDRLEIVYTVTAMLRRSLNSNKNSNDNKGLTSWVDWARQTTTKKKYVACCPIRLVRAVESIIEAGLNMNDEQLNFIQSSISGNQGDTNSETTEVTNSNNLRASVTELPWNVRNLNAYQTTMDEQYDLLAFSLAGRSSGNLTQSSESLNNTSGIRYKIGIDRTAIALGTSIGIEIMIEPTFSNCVIKSILFNIREARKYSMKVPAGHTYNINIPETKTFNEGLNMVLKWAFGYQADNGEEESLVYPNDKNKKLKSVGSGRKYVRQKIENSQYLAYFDPPQPGLPSSKSFLNSTIKSSNESSKNVPSHFIEKTDQREEESSQLNSEERDSINLKLLNQEVRVGEYFGGRFVMPVPDCSGYLNPSMEYESIKVSHWLKLVAVVECDGKTFDLILETPGRILDCRVVNGDECETILPPPPSYEPRKGDNQINHWTPSTFWEQREPITLTSEWGSSLPCPCERKKANQTNKVPVYKSTSGKYPHTDKTTSTNEYLNNSTNFSHNISSSNDTTTGTESMRRTRTRASTTNSNESCSPSHLPEWGPPPSYSNFL